MPSSSVIVRSSRSDDISQIALIYRHYVLESTATFETDPPDADEMNRRRTALLDLGFPYLVAEQEKKVVAYAYASIYRQRPAYRFTIEDSIYVHPQNLGQGCGSALLKALIVECEQGPWRQMIAVIGDTNNLASVRLHERFAFRRVGTLLSVGYKFDRWVDTVLMQRELGR